MKSSYRFIHHKSAVWVMRMKAQQNGEIMVHKFSTLMSKSDIFDFFKGRGSNNSNTGPQRDHSSFSTNRVTGAFAFIETGHPRRPGDK